jgi:hypothetical protein
LLRWAFLSGAASTWAGYHCIEDFPRFVREPLSAGAKLFAPLLACHPSRLPGIRKFRRSLLGESLYKQVRLQDIFGCLGLFNPLRGNDQFMNGISFCTGHGNWDATAIEKYGTLCLTNKKIEVPQGLGTGAAKRFHPCWPSLMLR